MMTPHTSLSTILFSTLLILFSCFNAAAQGKNPAKPCELFLNADAAALFKETISSQTERKTSFPAGHKCRYIYKKDSAVFGVTVRTSTTPELLEEGINDSARDLFSRQIKARTAGGHAKKTLTLIEGLGEQAFWNGNDLWILTEERVIIIDVDSHLAGSHSDMQAANQAQDTQNLALARQVAAIILSRL